VLLVSVAAMERSAAVADRECLRSADAMLPSRAIRTPLTHQAGCTDGSRARVTGIREAAGTATRAEADPRASGDLAQMMDAPNH
jgi:hypothetical protein